MTGPPGVTCSTTVFCRTCGGRANAGSREVLKMQVGFLVVMLAAGLGMAQQPAPVAVEGGLVQGTSEDGLTVYRGIPFAAPPVGDLRWRAPEPAAKWDGSRQAAKFAPSC